jgi:hypothetical protein
MSGAALLLAVLTAACSASSAPPATSAPAKPAGANAASHEAELIRAVRPTITSLIESLQKGDVAAARNALVSYDAAWNGIEVYINTRSPELYKDLETDLQAKLEDQLDAAQPNTASAVPNAQALLAKYDDAIRLVEAGPALNPLYDDVARLRIVRSNLRLMPAALKAGDLARAKTAYTAFQQGWPEAQTILRAQAPDALQTTEAEKARLDAAISAASPNPAELTPLVDSLMKAYNDGLTVVTNAAKAASRGVRESQPCAQGEG